MKKHIELYYTQDSLFFFDRPARPVKPFYFHMLGLFIMCLAIFFAMHACYEIVLYYKPNLTAAAKGYDGDAFWLLTIAAGVLFFVVTIMYACLAFERSKVVAVYICSEFIRINTCFGLISWNQLISSTKNTLITFYCDKKAEIRRNLIVIKYIDGCYKWNVPQIDEANWVLAEIQNYRRNGCVVIQGILPDHKMPETDAAPEENPESEQIDAIKSVDEK